MKSKQRGFTLIEMLVAITLVGILITITTEMFVRVMRVANRARIQAEIKNNAESSIAQLERVIRNASKFEGARTKTTAGDPWSSLTTVSPSSAWACDSTTISACELVFQNALDAQNRYTKIAFYKEVTNTASACPTDIFAQQYLGNKSCNGSLRIASRNDVTVTDFLSSTSPAPETTLTNVNIRSGVNVTAFQLQAFQRSNLPFMFRISFTLTQPIATGNRATELESNNYTTVLTLRNY